MFLNIFPPAHMNIGEKNSGKSPQRRYPGQSYHSLSDMTKKSKITETPVPRHCDGFP